MAVIVSLTPAEASKFIENPPIPYVAVDEVHLGDLIDTEDKAVLTGVDFEGKGFHALPEMNSVHTDDPFVRVHTVRGDTSGPASTTLAFPVWVFLPKIEDE